MDINPETYGFPKRQELVPLGSNHIGLVKLIKSRIIQKDAKKIVEMVQQIKKVDKSLEVSLVCSSNICSKSLSLLEREGVGVIVES